MASRPHQHRWLRCLSPSAAGSDTRAEKSSFSALGDWHCLAWIRHSTDASASANTCKHRCPDGSTTTPNCSGSRAPSRQTLQHRRYRGTCWQAGAGTGWSWPRGLCQHSCLPPRVRIGLDTSSCLRQGHCAPSAHSFSRTSPPPHTPCVSPASASWRLRSISCLTRRRWGPRRSFILLPLATQHTFTGHLLCVRPSAGH